MAGSVNLIPPINAAGTYVLLSPFTTKVVSGLRYTCNAVRTFKELLASGVDVVSEYYEANGLAESDYNTDYDNGVCIVTLQSSKGDLLYVPSSYIASYPDTSGVPYNATALSVILGQIPQNMDLEYLKSELIAAALDAAGIVADVRTVVYSETTCVSYEAHKALTAQRDLARSQSQTEYSKRIAVEAERDRLAAHVAALETFIANNHSLVDPTTTNQIG
jgi:hypothetical protein